MRLWLCVMAACFLTCLAAQADDVLAKQLFDQGVAASAQQRWQDAAISFGESLRERDRPATRFNLVLSYWELKEPLEVMRHALAFLSGPEPQSQRGARTRVAELLAQASKQLVTLDISGLPAPAQLKVDGEEPPSSAGRAYAEPGPHRLEASFAPDATEEVTVNLALGETRPWPRVERNDARAPTSRVPQKLVQTLTLPVQTSPLSLAAQPVREASSPRRLTAALLGGVGTAVALSAVSCLWLAESRADSIARRGTNGTQDAQYFRAVDRYVRVTNTVVPLALLGGALTATATLFGERLLRRGSLAWSLASLAVGVALIGLGGFWTIKEPRDLLPGTDVQRPSRQAGGLLLSASLPFLTFGVAAPLARKRSGLFALGGLLPTGVTW